MQNSSTTPIAWEQQTKTFINILPARFMAFTKKAFLLFTGLLLATAFTQARPETSSILSATEKIPKRLVMNAANAVNNKTHFSDSKQSGKKPVMAGSKEITANLKALAVTTLTFTQDETTWRDGVGVDGIAQDGEGGSTDIPGIVIQVLNITNTTGTNLGNISWENNTDFLSSLDNNYSALTYSDNAGSKGMAIKSANGAEFELNQFRYYNWGETKNSTNTVKGYRNSTEVASTTFDFITVGNSTNPITVTLGSAFDNVDEVRIYISAGGYMVNQSASNHSINDIEINFTAPVNSAPTDITLSASAVNQSAGTNAVVGTLQTTDADVADVHSYTLVAGAGSTDNASFNISGSSLRANNASALAANTYSVRVQTSDGTGVYSKALAITVADDISPGVASVTVPANGTYGVGANLDFILNMTEAVTVDLFPSIAVTIGGSSVNATYISGSGGSALTFRYTVQNGQKDLDGIAIGSAIQFDGSTVRDGAGNDAFIALNSVGNTVGVLVDATPPTVTSVVIADGTYGTGQLINITVTLNKDVIVSAANSTIAIQIGPDFRFANFISEAGGVLTYRYTVQVGENGDGVTVLANGIDLHGNTIRDLFSNNANLAFSEVFNPAAIVLPVTLVNFTAGLVENDILLSWQTTGETNASDFEIERSIDAKIFNPIGKVVATGEGKVLESYTFKDLQAGHTKASVLYYRLKMNDIGGAFAYSRIESVKTGRPNLVFAYPNPVSDRLYFDSEELNRIKSVSLINSSGQVIYETLKVGKEGLSTTHLGAGLYVVKITGADNNIRIQKVLVVK